MTDIANSNKEYDGLFGIGAECYRRHGSPSLIRATKSSQQGADLMRGNVAEIVYCDIKEGDSLETRRRKVTSALLGEGNP